jgi:hypothetical protein
MDELNGDEIITIHLGFTDHISITIKNPNPQKEIRPGVFMDDIIRYYLSHDELLHILKKHKYNATKKRIRSWLTLKK